MFHLPPNLTPTLYYYSFTDEKNGSSEAAGRVTGATTPTWLQVLQVDLVHHTAPACGTQQAIPAGFWGRITIITDIWILAASRQNLASILILDKDQTSLRWLTIVSENEYLMSEWFNTANIKTNNW